MTKTAGLWINMLASLRPRAYVRRNECPVPLDVHAHGVPALLGVEHGRRRLDCTPDPDIVLTPGLVCLVPATAWYRPTWEEEARIWSLVIHPTHLRVLHKQIRPGPPDRTPPDAWCHSPGPPEPALSDTLAALNACRDDTAGLHLVRALLRLAERAFTAADPEAGAPDRELYRAICDHLAISYRYPINRDEVARHFGIHPNHLSRIFARHGSRRFSDLLTDLRMARARELLSDPRHDIGTIALACGYEHLSYFCRRFKREHGLPPSAWRRQHQRGQANDVQ